MPLSTSAYYVSLNYGHHLIKWAIGRIRAGSMTPEQFAESQTMDAHPRDPRRATIARGLREIMAEKPENLPDTLR